MKQILCKLGFHKWTEPRFLWKASSNVRDWEKHCLRCGKSERWTEIVRKES